MKQNDAVQVRAENVTTGEERRNSTCLGLSTAKQNHEQTHYKANNDWDVFQDPMRESDESNEIILQGWTIQCTALTVLQKTIRQEFSLNILSDMWQPHSHAHDWATVEGLLKSKSCEIEHRDFVS